MSYFSYTHQNPTSGLFIEPDIDSNFRAINSINISDENVFSYVINPRSNHYLKIEKKNFFFHYLFEKQNEDGSYSDIGGIGNLFSTYETIETLDQVENTFIDPVADEDRIQKIGDYLSFSLEAEGWGFKLNAYANDSDIISTYCGIKLAKRFSLNTILSNENLSRFIISNWRLGGYSYSKYSPIETAQSTYYGINAFLEMFMNYSAFEVNLTNIYLSSLYNSIDGGYAETPGGVSTVQSTFYALYSSYILGLNPVNEIKTLRYVLSCNKTDGGFGLRPGVNFTSNFASGWAAMKAISLIENNGTAKIEPKLMESIKQIKINYYNWLYDHQALNGLFGQITVESNYLGALSMYSANSTGASKNLKMDNILDFVDNCYNPKNGGFSSQPGFNSSTFSTYCAINLYKMFYTYTNKRWLPNINATINFLARLQNPDGGFKVGHDLDYILSLFGPIYKIYFDLINTNISTVESTHWALYSLKTLEALDRIDLISLTHWIKSCQNADGGFSTIIGFYSDIISTYYGLEILKLLNEVPISKIAAIKFLKSAQKPDGSFDIIPAVSKMYVLPTSFIITYMASKSLYSFRYQPENVTALLNWFLDCISFKTSGVSDFPNFGGDLRNIPWGIILIDDLRYDRSLDPTSWNQLLYSILIVEIIIVALSGIVKTFEVLAISKRLKTILKLGEKLNVSYLQKFPAIYCENLCIYVGRKLIVDSMSMQLKHGEILGVLGESGAGKTTFVKSLLGMRKYKGVIKIYGMDVKKKSKKMRPIYGYVPQEISKIYENFTVLENLLYFGNQYGLTEKEIVSRAKRILRSLEIEDKINELVKNLSGGQKKRVSIAVGLIHLPAIIWMDEPTSGLDPVIRENLWLTLTRINEQFNTTLIVITHYPEESRFCNKIIIFGRNRGMMDFGRPEDLLSQLPGKGRTIEVYFNEVKEKAIERLESIEGIVKVLENKAGTEFSLFSDLNLNEIQEKVEREMGKNTIQKIQQSDAKMEQYFRYKTMVIPKVE